ncbi:hypothetical protein H0H81_009901 [Sphagnurus paluster]|uniref:Uncharacterized protein n=1 Tax=Sphagnurus paluster TaxID=117069 RepID=A0A9P7GQZ3_9AGAR|nr:hypothetical protein H0H81_009901 [Sphagnurus paluster]
MAALSRADGCQDPASVKAILDQLRVSQAWQQAVAPLSTEPEVSTPAISIPDQHVPVSTPIEGYIPDPAPATATSSPSVAALLSQLQSSSSWAPPDKTNAFEHEIDYSQSSDFPTADVILPSTNAVTSPRVQDPRSFTFQQALPRISQLADDSGFVAAVTKLKKEQDELERQLWEDRRNIYRKYEEKVKIATTK